MAHQKVIDASYNRLHGKKEVWRKPIGSMYYWYWVKRGGMLTLSHEEGNWYRANFSHHEYKFICFNITTAKRIAVLWAKWRMKQ